MHGNNVIISVEHHMHTVMYCSEDLFFLEFVKAMFTNTSASIEIQRCSIENEVCQLDLLLGLLKTARPT